MAESRAWPIPQPDGLLIHHVSDTHIGYRSWSYTEMDHMAADLESVLVPVPDVVVHTGDIVDDTVVGVGTIEQQDGYAVPWLATLSRGVPLVVAPGNHDFVNHPTRAGWEGVYGRPANSVTDVGGWRFVTFAPDAYSGDPWTIPDATWAWLDEACTTDSPVILADHYPPEELGLGANNSVQPSASLDELVAGHPNIAGMLCGHMHFQIDDARSTRLLTLGGRQIPVITDNSAVFSGTPTRDQLARLQTISTYLDVTPDRWRVHYRLHGTHAWSGPAGQRITTLDLAAGTITHAMT